ncbi:hypothetical protein BDY19DRAFT_894795 [Irpex rosettiformis]|uniref:Uncharacterized protein n=1 Tax=Irpex rosettiformis TaxID=378272 RepID=A0ACB8TX25_9APHY|nr:hypothetical protein BDY19DRAFT_894795 [Irpex rosettiformis]
MGGNAFATLLPGASFPRMSPEVYNRLKDDLTKRLQAFFEVVAVPREAPEKVDHGDLDFVVCNSRRDFNLEEVWKALGAREAVLLEGNRISNFAIPAEIPSGDASEVYHQVDVRVCTDLEEFDRAIAYNSYGDLGMILGSVTRAAQLVFGNNGLKLAKPVPTSPPCTLRLSASFPDILSFLSLSIDKWREGFATRTEIFDWVASSPLFDVWNARRTPGMLQKGKPGERPMYRAFIEYAEHRRSSAVFRSFSLDITDILAHFGKLELYNAILYVTRTKQYAKATFRGTLVETWTGIRGPAVGLIMKEVRERMGGSDVLATVCGINRDTALDNDIDPIHLTLAAWEDTMGKMTEDGICDVVLQVTEVLRAEDKLNVRWKDVKKLNAKQKALSVGVPVGSL